MLVFEFRKFVFVIIAVTLFSSSGVCLQCYKCYDTTSICQYGKKDYLGVLNCSNPNDVCATFQYETDDSERIYTTTVRGCQPLIKDGICNKIMKTVSSKNVVKRGISCITCDADLCNSSIGSQTMKIFILIFPAACYFLANRYRVSM